MLLCALALTACTLPQQLMLMLLPDETFTTLLANLRGVDETNRAQLAALEQRGDWPGVLAFAERNIARDPHTPEWWFVKGTAYGRLGDWRAAGTAFAQTVRLDPNELDAWHMLAQSQRLAGDSERAAQSLERSLAITRESPVTFFLLGETYRGARRMPQAIAAYQEAVRLEPRFSEALAGLARAQHRAGDDAGRDRTLARLRTLNAALAERVVAEP